MFGIGHENDIYCTGIKMFKFYWHQMQNEVNEGWELEETDILQEQQQQNIIIYNDRILSMLTN